MGTEYCIIKPKTKQVLELGRRLGDLDGIPKYPYKFKCGWCEWESVRDVMSDIFENCQYFLEADMKYSQFVQIAEAIYDFCDSEVLLDNDCSDSITDTGIDWLEWERVDLFSEILRKESWEELIHLIPREHWIIRDHIIYEFETVEKYLQKLAKGEK